MDGLCTGISLDRRLSRHFWIVHGDLIACKGYSLLCTKDVVQCQSGSSEARTCIIQIYSIQLRRSSIFQCVNHECVCQCIEENALMISEVSSSSARWADSGNVLDSVSTHIRALPRDQTYHVRNTDVSSIKQVARSACTLLWLYNLIEEATVDRCRRYICRVSSVCS